MVYCFPWKAYDLPAGSRVHCRFANGLRPVARAHRGETGMVFPVYGDHFVVGLSTGHYCPLRQSAFVTTRISALQFYGKVMARGQYALTCGEELWSITETFLSYEATLYYKGPAPYSMPS